MIVNKNLESVREELEVEAKLLDDLNKIENLNDVIVTVQDHALDEIYECETDEEKIELIVELMDEFYSMYISNITAEFLLNLARKGHVVEIEENYYPCFTVIPNTHYELLVNGKSLYYWGCLEDLDTLDQLEDILVNE